MFNRRRPSWIAVEWLFGLEWAIVYAIVFAWWKSRMSFIFFIFFVGFLCCHGCVVLCHPSWPLEHSSTCCCGKTSHTAGEARCRISNPASAHLHTLSNTVQSVYSEGCSKTWRFHLSFTGATDYWTPVAALPLPHSHCCPAITSTI